MVTPRKAKTAVQRKSKTTSTAKAPSKRSIKSYVSPARKTAGSGKQSATEKIQRKAYDIYLRRGCTHGLDRFDWEVAQTFVSLESAPAQSPKPKNRIKVDLNELEKDIQKKAYELYEKRGCAGGSSEVDWILAKDLVCLQNRIRL